MMKTSLGKELWNSKLFCHALHGCNTTSHKHDVGKGKAIDISKEKRRSEEVL
jgi:hypothetical protein